MFSSVMSSASPANDGASISSIAWWAGSMAIVRKVDAERVGQLRGVIVARIAGVARRQGDAVDAVGAERVDRDARDERGVDAAGHPEHDIGETVLLRVVASAEHQRVVDLVKPIDRRA